FTIGEELKEAGAGNYNEGGGKKKPHKEGNPAWMEAAVDEKGGGNHPPHPLFVFCSWAGFSPPRGVFFISPQYPDGDKPRGAAKDCYQPRASPGLVCQPHQGKEGADPARHLRVRCSHQRIQPFKGRWPSIGRRRWTASRSNWTPGADGCGARPVGT